MGPCPWGVLFQTLPDALHIAVLSILAVENKKRFPALCDLWGVNFLIFSGGYFPIFSNYLTGKYKSVPCKTLKGTFLKTVRARSLSLIFYPVNISQLDTECWTLIYSTQGAHQSLYGFCCPIVCLETLSRQWAGTCLGLSSFAFLF